MRIYQKGKRWYTPLFWQCACALRVLARPEDFLHPHDEPTCPECGCSRPPDAQPADCHEHVSPDARVDDVLDARFPAGSRATHLQAHVRRTAGAPPRVVQGDLLAVRRGVLCHQVNCRRVAGAGLARQIRRKWPAWYAAFRREPPRLGRAWFFPVRDGLVIASLYAQEGYGRRRRWTDYGAFREAVRQVAIYAADHDLPVFFPKGIGAGLAGGDWRTIVRIIADVCPSATIVERNG